MHHILARTSMVSDERIPPPLVDSECQGESKETFWRKIVQQLNFYRVHNLFFLFTPLFFSVIFYVSNGRYKISYIDSLFNCISAMTVCGLATIDLSTLTGFQQALLFIQMCVGNIVIISWVMVVIRKFFFSLKFENVLRNADDDEPERNKIRLQKLRPDMVRRLDNEPKLVTPSGRIPEDGIDWPGTNPLDPQASNTCSTVDTSACSGAVSKKYAKQRRRRSEPSHLSTRPSSSRETAPQRFETGIDDNYSLQLPRTQTIEFAPMPEIREHDPPPRQDDGVSRQRRLSVSSELGSVRTRHSALGSQLSNRNLRDLGTNYKNRGFGGFPIPWHPIRELFLRLFPTKFKQRIARTMTIPATISVTPSLETARPGTKQVSYITFEAIVGRNSAFHQLTTDQREELGGVEYRALNVLLWLIPIYHISCQLVSFVAISAYISQPRWRPIFQSEQKRPLSPVWFSAFQVVSAYTNTGMSLVDQSMLPFQDATLMILIMIFLILAGNAAFPVFLRFVIWCNTKVIKKNSRLNETLHFLLDHPRRCFIYLFPSHQTWFLLTLVLGLTLFDWVFLLVLDIGNAVIEQIPLGTRILDSLLQAVAVRAAGFVIMPLAAIAPAVKVLFVVMMYISVYPIAMSVRSTNVYEEQSLGIFHDEADEEHAFDSSGPRLSVWSRYLTMHARRQLAFDMWWLALSLFLICIIEKNQLENPSNFPWFTIFNIIFELVSAYGTVGLSLGISDQNYSFSGAMQPLSKLIICAVMLRGRHRGLPLAIDRAIMLHSELEREEEVFADDNNGNISGSEPIVDSQTLKRFGTTISNRSM